MNAAATSRTRIVKRGFRRSQPGHGDARRDSYPSAPSTAQSAPTVILIGAKQCPRPIRAPNHLTASFSRLAYNVNTAIKSP